MLKHIKLLFPKKNAWIRMSPEKRLGYIATWLGVLVTIAGILTGIINSGKKIVYFGKQNENVQLFHQEHTFKVLVIPFLKISEREGFDVGYVITKRLNTLNNNDSLNMEVYYQKHINPTPNFNSDSAKALLKKYGASMVIFGDYFIEHLNNGENKNMNLQFVSDSILITKNNNVFLESFSYEKLYEGQLQSDIEDCIYFFAAKSMFDQEKFERALYYINKIQTNGYLVYNYKIMSYLRLNDTLNANIYSDLFIKDYPNDGYAYMFKLFSNFLDLTFDNTYYIEKIKELSNENQEVLNSFLMLYYLFRQDTIAARTFLDQKIKENPANPGYYLFRSSIISDFQLSLEDINRAIQYDSTGKSYFVKAQRYMSVDSINLAITNYTNCINLNCNPNAYFQRAQLYFKIGENKKALKDINIFLELENLPLPGRIESHLLRAKIYERLNRKKKANREYVIVEELRKKWEQTLEKKRNYL